MTAPLQIAPNVQALLPHPTPRALGYHMPAEWSRHQATWLSWPHNPDTWSMYLPAVERALAEAVRWLSQGEIVHINVLDERHEKHVGNLLHDAGVSGAVQFYRSRTNDAWCRDHGAVFLVNAEQEHMVGLDWRFNAWGEKYPPFDFDDAIPRQMCEALAVDRIEIPMVLEGGAVEVNGAGVLMTTHTCLLNPNRNPDLQKHEIAYILRETLGVDDILWLAGELAGDDTDGHIDNLARFVDETTIVLPEETDWCDVNYASLQTNTALVKAWNKARGNKFKVIHLPMPAPVLLEGKRMPASYMNFYIGNEVVLMPTFNNFMDKIAHARLQACFKDRLVVPVDCKDVIWGLGALHCLTQQVPLATKKLEA